MERRRRHDGEDETLPGRGPRWVIAYPSAEDTPWEQLGFSLCWYYGEPGGPWELWDLRRRWVTDNDPPDVRGSLPPDPEAGAEATLARLEAIADARVRALLALRHV
jgi:hypothetical protein